MTRSVAPQAAGSAARRPRDHADPRSDQSADPAASAPVGTAGKMGMMTIFLIALSLDALLIAALILDFLPPALGRLLTRLGECLGLEMKTL